MAYIANKPVRFDKDYSIGEIIPDGVIDPKMEKRLIDWGKIVQVKLPVNKEEPEENIKFSNIPTEDKGKKEKYR